MTAILDPRTTETPEPVAVAPAPAPAFAPAPQRTPTAAAPEPPRPPWTPTRTEMRRYGLAVFALFALALAVQPVADGPDPSRPGWAVALDTVATFGLLGLVVATVGGRRWGLWAGLAVGAPMFVISLSCPVSGHHEYAAWWGIQLAATAVITVLSAVLLRRTRAS